MKYKKITGIFMPGTRENQYILSRLSQRSRLGALMLKKGKITANELRHFLQEQKTTGKKLGIILVEQGVITERYLKSLLFRQKAQRAALKFAALSIFSLTSLSGGAATKANMISPAAGYYTSSRTSNSALNNGFIHYSALYGTFEQGSRDLGAFTKWNQVLRSIALESGQPQAENAMRDWKGQLAYAATLPTFEARVEYINTYVNRVRYVPDSQNYGQSDYWATPADFFTRGGDCEDYAITKYISLRALGVPEEQLRLVILQDEQKNIPHAVLAVYGANGIMILDNQINNIQTASTATHYRPIYSINQQGWWLHQAPETYQVASR